MTADQLRALAEANSSLRPMSQKLQEVDRLTAVVNIYHQHYGSAARALQFPFSKLLETQAQAYSRDIDNFGCNWQPIDLGWLAESPGLLVLLNRTGKRDKTNNSSLLIALNDYCKDNDDYLEAEANNGFQIIKAANPQKILLRSSSTGTTDITIFVVPR